MWDLSFPTRHWAPHSLHRKVKSLPLNCKGSSQLIFINESSLDQAQIWKVLHWHYPYKALMSPIPLWSGREGEKRKGSRKMSIINVYKDPGPWEGSARWWPVHKGVTAQAVGLTCVVRGATWRLLIGLSCSQPKVYFLSHHSLSGEVKVTNNSGMIRFPDWLADHQRTWRNRTPCQQGSRQQTLGVL